MSIESARAFCMRMMSDDEFRDSLTKVQSAADITAIVSREYDFSKHDLLKIVCELTGKKIAEDELEKMVCGFYEEELAAASGNKDAVKHVSEWFKSLK